MNLYAFHVSAARFVLRVSHYELCIMNYELITHCELRIMNC